MRLGKGIMRTGARADADPMWMSEEALALVAQRFRALGEPSRLKLVRVLMDGEKAAGPLGEEAGLGQANASRHLQVLVDAGILGRRKDGLQVFYGLADPALPELCKVVCEMVRRGHERVSEALMPAGVQESPSQRGKRPRKVRA
jgi:ArsR family transcriptional regulator